MKKIIIIFSLIFLYITNANAWVVPGTIDKKTATSSQVSCTTSTVWWTQWPVYSCVTELSEPRACPSWYSDLWTTIQWWVKVRTCESNSVSCKDIPINNYNNWPFSINDWWAWFDWSCWNWFLMTSFRVVWNQLTLWCASYDFCNLDYKQYNLIWPLGVNDWWGWFDWSCWNWYFLNNYKVLWNQLTYSCVKFWNDWNILNQINNWPFSINDWWAWWSADCNGWSVIKGIRVVWNNITTSCGNPDLSSAPKNKITIYWTTYTVPKLTWYINLTKYSGSLNKKYTFGESSFETKIINEKNNSCEVIAIAKDSTSTNTNNNWYTPPTWKITNCDKNNTTTYYWWQNWSCRYEAKNYRIDTYNQTQGKVNFTFPVNTTNNTCTVDWLIGLADTTAPQASINLNVFQNDDTKWCNIKKYRWEWWTA